MLWRVRAVLTGFRGAPGLNTFYGIRTGPTAEQDQVNNFAQRVSDFYTALNTAVPSTSILTNQYVVNIEQIVALIDETNGNLVDELSAVFTPTSVAGTSTVESAPNAVNLLLKAATAGIVNNRRVRGRAFIGPPVNRTNDDGTPQGADRTVLSDAGTDNLITPGDPALNSPEWAIWARPFPGTTQDPNPRLGSEHAVTSVIVPDFFAIQRSRRD